MGSQWWNPLHARPTLHLSSEVSSPWRDIIFSNLLWTCASSDFQLISLIAIPEDHCWPLTWIRIPVAMKETLMILTLATRCRTFSLPFQTHLILYTLLCASFYSCYLIPWCYYDSVSKSGYIVIKTSKCHYKTHHLSQQPFVTYSSPRGRALWDFSLCTSCPLSTSTGVVIVQALFW